MKNIFPIIILSASFMVMMIGFIIQTQRIGKLQSNISKYKLILTVPDSVEINCHHCGWRNVRYIQTNDTLQINN